MNENTGGWDWGNLDEILGALGGAVADIIRAASGQPTVAPPGTIVPVSPPSSNAGVTLTTSSLLLIGVLAYVLLRK